MKSLTATQKKQSISFIVTAITSIIKRRLRKGWEIESIQVDNDKYAVEVVVALVKRDSTYNMWDDNEQFVIRPFTYNYETLPNTCTMFEIGELSEFDEGDFMDTNGFYNKSLSATERLLIVDIIKHAFLLSLEHFVTLDQGGNLFVITMDIADTPHLAKAILSSPNIFTKKWKPNRTKSNLLTALFSIEKPRSKATNTSSYRKRR